MTDIDISLPKGYSTKPDTDGIYEKVYFKKEDGKILKVTQKINRKLHQTKTLKRVINRKKNWVPFGKATSKDNSGSCFIGDEVFMELVGHTKELIENKDVLNSSFMKIFENKLKPKKVYKPPSYSDKNIKSKTVENTDNTDNKYVPRFKRENKHIDPSEELIDKRKLILLNLPPHFREDDIAAYVRDYGDIKDIKIIRDKYTGKSRGFGFILLYREDVAQTIIDNIDKKPMGSMIVNVKFAESRNSKR